MLSVLQSSAVDIPEANSCCVRGLAPALFCLPLPRPGEHSLNTLQALKSPSLLLENLTKAHTKQESKKRGLGSQGSLKLAMT